MYYDMHVHSTFSTDSTLKMECAIIKAIDLGLTGISFTDHLDVDYVGYENDFHYDFNDYFSALNNIKDKYNSKIDIISAVEIGLQPHVIEETSKMLSGFDFDYKIGSTHLIQKKDPYCGNYFLPNQSKIDAYNIYLEELFNNLKLFESFNFNTMGHFDYLVRYANFDDSTLYYNDHSSLLDEIFKFIISKNISLEINTSTYLKSSLDMNVLKRYKELGGYLITIGSDAHNINRIGVNFSKYVDILKSIGFNYLYYFKNSKPIPYLI